MTTSTIDRANVSSRSLRQERLEQLFGATGAQTPSSPPAEQQQFTDPVFASAARDALSADSATFLRQSRQTRGE
jgi:hypothetical protein